MDDEIEVIMSDDGKTRVRLMSDWDGEMSNPREYMATEIVTPRLRNWNVATPDAEFQDQFDQLYERCGGEAFARYMRIFHGIEVLPVYMYEHSAVALSVGSFVGRAQHADWDSGQIGWAYITPERIEETGITDYEGAIATEVETLGQWMNGEVYGYVVEELHHYKRAEVDADGNFLAGEFTDAEDEWEETDSCWGFIGYDNVESEARAAAGIPLT